MALYAFDGTWNKKDTDSDELDENTNVYNFLRFYAAKDPDAERQLEDYKTGVGTRYGEAGRIVGGFFGAGGRDRVHEMVNSFAENWKRNGPEDRTVDVIGFSRGAALALHFCNQLAKGVPVGPENIKPAIRFLGLWDVVPSFGLPGILSRDANDINLGWELDVPDTVEHCFHAMALDERRGAFNVHRLDAEQDDFPRIQEWWFRGVHSDVGGGNGNVARGNIALRWMLQRAAECGCPIDVENTGKLAFNLEAEVKHADFSGRIEDRHILKGDNIHPSAGKKLEAGESVTMEVDSKLWFDFSGVLVEQGAQYLFAPDPNGRWKDKTIECDASGWPENLNRGRTVFGWLQEKVLESHALALSRRVAGANWFEMVACVGTCAKPAVAVGRGEHQTQPWTSPEFGALFFFANDARLSGFGHDLYQNNSGTISVTIQRVA